MHPVFERISWMHFDGLGGDHTMRVGFSVLSMCVVSLAV